MLRLYYASSFDATRQQTSLQGRSSPPIAPLFRLAPALRMMCDALREGLAACRHYEGLRSRGIPHDAAIRGALGIGRSPVQGTRGTGTPLCFAGKA